MREEIKLGKKNRDPVRELRSEEKRKTEREL